MPPKSARIGQRKQNLKALRDIIQSKKADWEYKKNDEIKKWKNIKER